MLFERLDQRGFRESRRRFGEVLRAAQLDELYRLTFNEGRQDTVVVIFRGVIDAFEIDRHEAREHQRRAVGTQQVTLWAVGTRQQIDGDGIEHGVGHLAGDGAFPDQRIEALQIVVDAALEHLRQHCGGGRSDGFVGFLGVARFVLVEARALGHRRLAIQPRDDLADLAEGLVGEVHGIGTHVGDETHRALAVVDTFVELLCKAHGALCAEPELAGGFLLQGGGGERGCRVAVALFTVDRQHAQRAGRKEARRFRLFRRRRGGIC